MEEKRTKRRRTSVSGRGLDDGVPGFEEPVPLGVLHHPQADPVLHAAAGVEKLALGHCGDGDKEAVCFAVAPLGRVEGASLISLTYLTLESKGFGDFVDVHHGRLPNAVQNVWEDCWLDFPTGRNTEAKEESVRWMFQRRREPVPLVSTELLRPGSLSVGGVGLGGS